MGLECLFLSAWKNLKLRMEKYNKADSNRMVLIIRFLLPI